ncbi:MAG: ABC transporter substrate-binding protein [Proteobacteria bacterium]|nr:ABC transporter substrate-binding protein [Pseudomonadota bacterium]
MKKMLAVAMSILALTFASYTVRESRCADAAKDDKQTSAGAMTVVGFSQVGVESDWRMANTQSMKKAFSEKKGYKLIIKDAQQKQSRQIAAIRDFIAQRVDYIVLAPVTEEGWDKVLREAKDAGIPVIIVDRMIKTSDNDLFTCWVGSDFRKEGGTAVIWMEKNLGSDKDLHIAHLQGSMGSSAQIGRTEALQAGVSKNPGWRMVASDSGDFTQAKGKEVMERILKQYPQIDVLYCENDNMAFGAMEAMDEVGRTYGVKGATKIISFDATHAGLTATLEGKINFNVECNPLHGPRVEEIIRRLKTGERPAKLAYVDEAAFDATVITQAELDQREY